MEKKQQIVVIKPTPPDLRTVTPIKVVVGDNPKVANLKDHPDFDGKTIIITKARVSVGEMGNYIVMACYVLPTPETQPTDEHAVTLMTGSENVVERVGLCANDPEVFPIRGTLRKAGRAWFLD